ncbi:MAG: uracil-xanthine permease [Desulfuromonadales bacterium]|nr:uracil-xanthine permease [Desulfuromonadales bacterium]
MTTPRLPTDYHFRLRDSLVGAQMLFVAFGALVLVPLLTGLDPNVALFTAGVGTLVFQIVTRGQVPIFLASSFAFIAPIIYGVQTWGSAATMGGLAVVGLIYLLLGTVVKLRGVQVISRLFPPIVTGPVIMVIGLILAPVAVHMANGRSGDGSLVLVAQSEALVVAGVALVVTIAVSLVARGMLRLVPILCGLTAGYLLALAFGMVDFTPVREAPWFAIPSFVLPTWNTAAVLYMIPVALAPAIEHFGDVLAISSVTGKDYLKKPGIHRTLFGDGLATALAACLGGPPNTTYSEVTGAVTLTRAFNPAVMTWAALTAVLLAFVGKLGALLQTVPVPVMGGILVLLFGAIAVVGLNTLVVSGENLLEARNLSIIALIIVFGMGGMVADFGVVTFSGIGLAAVVGVLLNLILPGRKNLPPEAQVDPVALSASDL